MSTTGARTLRLLSLLQGRRQWSGAELAERLGVSLRTLRRDVDRLRELGYPVDAARGVDGGYHLAPGAALPPLVLDDEEAVALTVGLLSAVESPFAGSAEASARALGKVVHVLPRHLRRRVEAISAATAPAAWTTPATVDATVLTTLAQACRDVERVAFGYTAADGTRTARRVEPYRLVTLRAVWYLVAYDMTRQDWRTFRLDRVAEALPTGARFAPRPQPFDDAAAFVRSRLAQLPRHHAVAAIVWASAGEVRTRIGRWATVEEAGDPGACRVDLRTDSLDWAAFALLTLGVPFEVVAPPELVAHLRGWVDRLGRAVSAGGR
ncbi:MAG: helix-turn-helix transcriptional regulator [Acidimicrobiales bacterium]